MIRSLKKLQTSCPPRPSTSQRHVVDNPGSNLADCSEIIFVSKNGSHVKSARASKVFIKNNPVFDDKKI